MRTLLCCAVVMSLLFIVGCTCPNAPVMAGLVIDQKGPVGGVDNFDSDNLKAGRAQAQGVLLVGFGDASVSAAAKEANITRIHHVDSSRQNVLGSYSKYETIVYGE